MRGLDLSRASEWSDVAIPNWAPSKLFQMGDRPVIRWVKGNGLDDVITRSALAQATELFGAAVDFCLCTSGLDAPRVRNIMAWARQPVHWWPLHAADNPELAAFLTMAGCPHEHFGYWWKWFPERVRPGAPEWILDGDMVIVRKPPWFEQWLSGEDCIRVSAGDPYWPISRSFFGECSVAGSDTEFFYSGLVSLPPASRYMPVIVDILQQQPLQGDHDGRRNMSEQGAIAEAFRRLEATPIPLPEFPFARAFEERLDAGFAALPKTPWGYHFGNAFRRENHHFARLVDEEVVYWRDEDPPLAERYRWLSNRGQWGRPGWSMHPGCLQRILALAECYAGQAVLEIGTSRGHLTAALAEIGCVITSVDQEDRGASLNLRGLCANAVISEATEFLTSTDMRYALIVVDLHGNSEAVWRELWPLLWPRAAPGGTIVLYNSHLWEIPEWRSETGLKWLIDKTPAGFTKQVFARPLPGMIVLSAARAEGTTPEIRSPTVTPAPRIDTPRPAEAAALAVKALETWPEDVRLHEVLCSAYEALNRREDALESARRLVALAPHHPGYRERLARHLFNMGYIDQAEVAIGETLTMAPDRPGAHHLFSLVKERRQDYAGALAEAREAVRLDPRRPGMLHHLGALLMREGSFDDAAAALTRAIELAPKMASHRVLLSRILARQGKLEAAIASVRTALQLDPTLTAAMTLQNELERSYPAREAVTTRSSARVGTAARAQDGGP